MVVKYKQNMKDDLGLKKLERDLNKALDFNIFPKPTPRYTKQKKQSKKEKKFFNGGVRHAKDYSTEIKVVKSAGKETKKGITKLVDAIKNRKIRKLEKQALKAKDRADKLAHEIKTRHALSDSITDIARYEKELEKIKQEERERLAQLQDKKNGRVADSPE